MPARCLLAVLMVSLRALRHVTLLVILGGFLAFLFSATSIRLGNDPAWIEVLSIIGGASLLWGLLVIPFTYAWSWLARRFGWPYKP